MRWKKLFISLSIGLLSLATLALVLALTLKHEGIPDEINMAHMDHGSNHSAHTAAPSALVACESLKDPSTNAAVRTFDLTAAKTDLRLDNGTSEDSWTFNGTAPGPELRVTEGERIRVQLRNENIEAGVTIHWHGVILPCSQDGVAGVTQNAVMPGETFTYDFIARHPGTYWYHSHQMSSVQAKKALIGRLIVEPKNQTTAYDRDYAVTLHKLGETYLANGKMNSLSLDAKPGDFVRLRIINADNVTNPITIPDVPFRVVSMDARDIAGPAPLLNQRVNMPAGGRIDLLFQVPEQGARLVYAGKNNKEKTAAFQAAFGASILSLPNVERISAYPLFDYTVYGEPPSDAAASETKYDRLFDMKLTHSTAFLNGTTSTRFESNGEAYHHIHPFNVKEGDRVKVTVFNDDNVDLPIHLHGHSFQVLTKNGKPMTGSPIVLDTVLTEPGDTFEIGFLADNPGLWMLHCHNLIHAQLGMSMMLNYEGITTSYTVGKKSGNIPD